MQCTHFSILLLSFVNKFLSHFISSIKYALFLRATTPIQKSKFVPKGGIFVVGEEQDAYGGDFTPEESFFGDLSQLNVWNRELSASEVYDLATSCGHDQGNVVAWSDFNSQITGNIQKKSPSLACDCKSLNVNYIHL